MASRAFLRFRAALGLALTVLPASEAAGQEMMNAAVASDFGPPGVLRVERVPRPVPTEGEMLVRVYAAGVNPVDAAVRSGRARGMVGAELPYVPGFDVSGVVAELGPGVAGFTVGDEVFAMLNLRRGGGYAEYAIVRTDEAARKPTSLSHAQAAALPLVALTSMQALFDHADLQAGDDLLIHGGAGGVGSVAVQLAKWRGARVTATASEPNHAFLEEIGADMVIDYRTERFEEVVSGVDVVLDPVGGDTQRRSLGVLRDGGTLVSLVGTVPETRTPPRGIQVKTMLVHPDTAQLQEIARLVDEGHLRPVVSLLLPLERAAEAHEQIETGHTRGKIVLEIPR